MFTIPYAQSTPLREKLRAAYLQNERSSAKDCHTASKLTFKQSQKANKYTRNLVKRLRTSTPLKGVESLLHEYALSEKEGVVLMCLAESFLRIPDTKTTDKLIEDKLRKENFASHKNKTQSLFANASNWGLIITGKILNVEKDGWAHTYQKFVKRCSMPFIRMAINEMMKVLGRQFVVGETIESALYYAKQAEREGYRYSYDMLGEAAKTAHDALAYYRSYQNALHRIGIAGKSGNTIDSAGISVKISALHPRYEFMAHKRFMEDVTPKIAQLCLQARRYKISLFIDAEEMERLDISLDIIEALFRDERLKGWNGLGIAVQTYSKRAPYLVDFLVDLAKKTQQKMMIRLVKGAYWDTEIKRAQEMGLSDYPVFTRKEHTDMCYIACAKKILNQEHVYPCFATHNARTIAEILSIADNQKFEFQKLHGMGDFLYRLVMEDGARELGSGMACRIYAPVGQHADLLPYLVRRLLENGANNAFVHRLYDGKISLDDLTSDPREVAHKNAFKPHPNICLPINVTLPERQLAKGVDFTDGYTMVHAKQKMNAHCTTYAAFSLIKGQNMVGKKTEIFSPQDKKYKIGTVDFLPEKMLVNSVEMASMAYGDWRLMPVAKRANTLYRAADLLEKQMFKFVTLLTLEAGKTIKDGIAEVREAIDFLRYYANCARRLFVKTPLSAITGEENTQRLHGRGVFFCISPWNFPLAIFIGQVASALVAGNTVVAKPSEATSIVAFEAVKVLFSAGLPPETLSLVLGEGSSVGEILLGDPRIAGVAFTGSFQTAKTINLTLAQKSGPIVPVIAETGGQNAMLVDSSALLEQVVQNALEGAFQSSGQRCSATRILLLQQDIADAGIKMLAGAIQQLNIANPLDISADVGPIIDTKSMSKLHQHVRYMEATAKLLAIAPLSKNLKNRGNFFAPRLYEIPNISILKEEVFGPILHVMRWDSNNLKQIVESINAMGYGLTFSVHSRIDSTVDYILSHVNAGNIYVNRNQIGATVGMQPFGGEGKSGTGFKAGGINYLLRFAQERTVSIDTTASGGNASLMATI